MDGLGFFPLDEGGIRRSPRMGEGVLAIGTCGFEKPRERGQASREEAATYDPHPILILHSHLSTFSTPEFKSHPHPLCAITGGKKAATESQWKQVSYCK